MISVNHLEKKYDGHSVINNVSFELLPGKCVALLGPNGAGKTTTLRMMSGLIKPTKGSIHLQGSKAEDIREHIGYLPQHPQFHLWMTGKEFLIYVGQLAHLSKKEATGRAEELLHRVGIADAKNRRIAKYSGGMKQRLGIAQAMIHSPQLLILDEPVSSLDPIGRRDVLHLIDELKEEMTLLFSTHILSDAEQASDEILLMHHGEIVESGSLESVRSRHQVNKISIRFSKNTLGYKEELEALEGVIRVEENKEAIHLYVEDPQQACREILHLASQNDWPITHFEVGHTTLEDLFMKVVSTHAVDYDI